jgi:hypothetical protein
VIDEQFLLCIFRVYVEQQRVLVQTDLRWHFEFDIFGKEISAVNLVKGEFALVPVVNHGFELIQIPGEKISEVPQNPI